MEARISLLFLLCVYCFFSSLQAQDGAVKDSVDLSLLSYAELDSLAMVYRDKGDYQSIIPYLETGMKKAKAEFGEIDSVCSKYIGNLGWTYHQLGRYKKAESLFLEVINIDSKVYGEEHYSYAISLNNLAYLYKDMGKYEEAKLLFFKSIKIKEKTLGSLNPSYASSLMGLATLYIEMDLYEKVEPLNLKAMEIIRTALGEESSYYSTVLNNLASFYSKMGRYKEAESLYLQSIEIKKRVWGENYPQHPRYAITLFNLADLYQRMKKHEQVEALYLEVRKIWKKTLGKEHPLYADILHSLASFYFETNKYEQVEKLYLQVKRICTNKLGKDHHDYVLLLNNLAGFYLWVDKYEQAESLLLEAKKIGEKTLGEQQFYYASTLDNLSTLYMQTKRYQEAESLSVKSTAIIIKRIKKNYKSLAEEQQKLFLSTTVRLLQNLYRLTKAYPSATLRTRVQDVYLASKGLSLSNSNTIRKLIKVTKDSTLNQLYGDWQYTRRLIYKGSALPSKIAKKRGVNIDSLISQANKQEQQLARNSKIIALQLQKDKKQITFTDLKNNLSPNEVCIDILHFPFYNTDRDKVDSIVYYALLTHSTSTAPEFIRLGLEKELQNILRFEIKPGKSNYTTHSYLYKLIWRPLLPYLDEVKTIHLSLSGILHKVSFEALSEDVEKELYLADQYTIHYYGTLRDFVLNKEKKETSSKKSIALFGGAKFKMDSSHLAQLVDTSLDLEESWLLFENKRGIPVNSGDSIRSRGFGMLKGSLEEVQRIGKLFEAKTWKVHTFTQEKALEDKVKMSSGRKAPSVLHFATHGYFFSTPKQSVYWGKDKMLRDRLWYHPNPLFRSGLAFTGANYAWLGGIPIKGLEDGILTAYEVAGLDLYNTELAVLSACETGKGTIDNNEGVLGLQRAFKTAGVDKLIISLWKVDDKATRLLMEQFYKNYLDGEPIVKALKNAQLYLRNYLNKDGEKIYSSPYFWGSFILIN